MMTPDPPPSEEGIAGYAAAFRDWDESEWDHLAGDGLEPEPEPE